MYLRIFAVACLLGAGSVWADGAASIPVAAETVSTFANTALAANIKAIPYQLYNIVYLPIGVGQATASVFTGGNTAPATQNIMRGLMAPVRIVRNVIAIPFNLIP